jgi:hypothetical protein
LNFKGTPLQDEHKNIFGTVLCSSCDGVPLKLKKKNWRASSLPAQII